MKHFLKSILLWLGLSGLAFGGPAPVFNNYGVLDTVTNINAVRFINSGVINFDTGVIYYPLSTAYFTNTGTMTGFPGFEFADVSPSTIHPSVSFVNRGVITGSDGGGSPSKIVVNATTVVNSGTLVTGNNGTMTVTGKNVDLSYGIVEAGNSAGASAGSIGDTLTAEQYFWVTQTQGSTAQLFTEDAANTFDLVWGATNGLMARVANLITPDPIPDGLYSINLPGFFATNRSGFASRQPVRAQGLTAFAYTYAVPPGQITNIYYDVVLLDANAADFLDPNLMVTVQFGSNTPGVAGFNYVPPNPSATGTTGGQNNANGVPILVTYSEATTDPITGNTVTNSAYLEDDGDTVGLITVAQNAADVGSPYSRPDSFELTFTAPPQIPAMDLVPTNTVFATANISGMNMASAVLMTNGVYEAQIGVNPESLSGSFGGLTGLETLANIPDVSNSPGRLTINAENLNLHNLKLNSEGLLTINATNVTGLPTVFGFSTADINLGAKTSSLVVSNLIPILFEQLRGDIEGWDGTWDNLQTNISSTATNIVDIHTHVLYAAQNLNSKYTPTVRNFYLKSTNMVVRDNVEVIQNSIFNGRNLTIISNIFLTQSAGNFTPANAPNLKNLLVASNASFIADSLLDVGFHLPVTVTSPIGRGYSVLSVTNQGLIQATAPTLLARTIENDGKIQTVNNGSVILAANTLGFGYSTNEGVAILSGGTVTLSANTIEITNTTIDANQLILTPVKELTDFVAGTLATNGDLVNFWAVTNELELTRKPAKGDLYGTQIHLIAKDGPPTFVIWAGADKGDSPSGFVNNAVIGDLILDRETNTAVMEFNAAGNKNALYVNYLELTNASASDYTENVIVDPHLKIYFAAANVPINKVTNISPQFVYAANSVAEAFAAREPGRVASSLPVTSTPGAPVAVPPAGIYSGLFAPSTGVSLGDSGFLTFTLEKNGAFSGHALIGSEDVPFSSKLVGSRVASVEVGALSIIFTIDSTGNLLGEVTGEGWDADLSGAVAGSGSSANAGRYVITLPGPGGAGPSAASVGHVTVSPQGVLTTSGRLADGAAFSQSTRVNKNGQWPFYAYAPTRKDVLMGWLSFAGDPAQVSGSVTWMKPAEPVGAYRAGFQGVVQVVGAAGK